MSAVLPRRTPVAAALYLLVVLTATAVIAMCRRAYASPSTPDDPYWSAIPLKSDSATARAMLERRGYVLAEDENLGSGVLKFIGPDSTDIRVVLLDEKVVRIGGTMRPDTAESHLRALIPNLIRRYGAPDSVSRQGVRLPGDSAVTWERWAPDLSFRLLWRRDSATVEVLALRRPKAGSGRPLIMLSVESFGYDVNALVRQDLRRAKQEVAKHVELDEPIVLGSRGPLNRGWVLLADAEAGRISAERNPERQSDGTYRAWLRIDQREPDAEGVARVMARHLVDCKRRRVRMTHVSTYDVDDSLLSHSAISGRAAEWDSPPERSSVGVLMSRVCARARTAR